MKDKCCTMAVSLFQIRTLSSIIKFLGSNCKCKDLINRNNVGNCKGKKPSQFGRKFVACYVTQPSNCTDLKDSGTNPGEQLSVNACLLRGRVVYHIRIKYSTKENVHLNYTFDFIIAKYLIF